VCAVGTAFNVNFQKDAVEVLVTEGKVRIEDADQRRSLLVPVVPTSETPLLLASERAIVPIQTNAGEKAEPLLATVTKMTPAGVQHTLAWQEHRLSFDQATLAEIVRQFNRYNRIQLVIDDPLLARRHYSGVFLANDGLEPFVRLLEEDFGVLVTRGTHEIILRSRSDS